MSATARDGSRVYEAELTREVGEFCRRVLGDGAAAREAAEAALAGRPERVVALGRAARACRQRAAAARAAAPMREVAPVSEVAPASEVAAGVGLAAAAGLEVAVANQALPGRQREALALREQLRLSYAQIGLAIGIDVAAVASLLARARLGLRAELRGAAPAGAVDGRCAERERALRVLARRQDSESLDGDDDDWILRHIGECQECARAHAAMLEASVRYRAWKRGR